MPEPTPPPVNPTTLEFLQQLYGNFDLGWLTLFSLDRPSAERGVAWSPVDDLEQLAERAAELHGQCVWFGVATRRRRLSEGRRGGADDCEALPGLWVDIDVAGPNHATEGLPTTIEAAWELVKQFPVPPTVIVTTGGGLQPWWLFAEPLTVDDAAKRLLTRWGATWASIAANADVHIDNVFDLPRVMRLPGTMNTKAAPVTVGLFETHWERRFGTDDLDQWLEDPPPPPATRTIDRIPYIGPERPGDAYNARHSGEEVLASLGFEPHGHRHSDGSLHYNWPAAAGDVGATAYPDGHVTIWSETFAASHRAVDVRRPYDPFGLLVAARHDGDFSAASEELHSAGYGTNGDLEVDAWMRAIEQQAAAAPGDPVEEDVPTGMRPVDWSTFWATDRAEVEWHIYPVLPAGRQAAIWAVHKTGKSLFTLDMVAAIATGRSVLSQPPVEPLRVLYLDMEMTEDDLEERLTDLGYGAKDDLSNLVYYLLPSLPPLDTDRGGQVLDLLCEQHGAQLCVIDTMSRVVEGEENSADTYKDFYRHSGIRLKRRGVSLIRIDHGGKDESAGMRGSSAKGDDVDIVWLLKHSKGNEFELVRKASRMAGIPEKVQLKRELEPLRHTLVSDGYPAGTAAVAELLDSFAAAIDISERAARTLLAEHQESASNDKLRAALRFRRKRSTDDLSWAEGS